MLDLSAAFDVIDHRILLNRLKHSFGITSDPLAWLESYLKNRTQCVKIGDVMSSSQALHFGVPQGSVLGPMMYCMFTRPVGEIIRSHNISYHCYADDTQLYLSFSPNDSWNEVKIKLQSCVEDVSRWMYDNMLKLNHEKTELIVFAPKTQSNVIRNLSIQVDSNEIHSAESVKNLGIYLDKHLTMKKQIDSVVKSCNYHIRSIGNIRKFISDDVCKILVHSLVTSRLDYGNALLSGLPQALIGRLQRVQNCAARLVTRTRLHEHITPILQNLHWLPIYYRSQFKILLYTYKTFNDSAPVYIRDQLQKYQPSRSLRSQSKSLLVVPKVRSSTYENRRFDRCAATLWNNLPDGVKRTSKIHNFKKLLKTFLFKSAFS